MINVGRRQCGRRSETDQRDADNRGENRRDEAVFVRIASLSRATAMAIGGEATPVSARNGQETDRSDAN
jgi:hypothetical protein